MSVPKERLDTQRNSDHVIFGPRKSSFNTRSKSLGQRFLNFVGKQISVDYQERLVLRSLQAQNNNAKKFFEILLASKNNFKSLTNYHLNLLNDKALWSISTIQRSSSFKVILDQLLTKRLLRVFKPIVEAVSQWCMTIPLFFPESKKIVLWDVIAILSKLYFLYLIPLDLAWVDRQLLYNRYFTATIIMLLLLFLDFIVGLNTAYYSSGSLVTDRIKIIKHQFTKTLGLEWISTIILMVLFIISKTTTHVINVNINPVYLISLTFLSHQISVHHKARQYELALNLSKKTSSYLGLFKFLLLLFYVIHLFACLWFWAGNYSSKNYEINWLDSVQHDQEVDWDAEYLQAFYFICVTMFTVGYGDITPKSGLEKIICILLILVSSIQLPYSINTVGSIIQRISGYGEETKNKLRTINSYMNKKRVPYQMQNQIRQYLHHYWESLEGQDTEEEKTIIDQLSGTLKEQLIKSANSQIFAKNPLLRDNFSQQLQQNLLKKVQAQQLQPEQIIESDGEINCYFIEEGEIDVLIESGMRIQKAKKNEILGIKNLFTGQRIKEKFKSIGFTKILILSRCDFLQALKEFPNDYEKYCSIKDDLIFNYKSSYITVMCESCNLIGHQIDHCPMLHHVPQKDLIIKRSQHSFQQQRKVFARRYYKLQRFLQDKIENADFNEIKQQFLKKYYLPPVAQSIIGSNAINTVSIENKNQEEEENSEEKSQVENLQVSVAYNNKKLNLMKDSIRPKRDSIWQPRESMLGVSFIPTDHIDQVKRSINNNKRQVNPGSGNKNKNIESQLDGMGLQRQNSFGLGSRRQSNNGNNVMNFFQINLNQNLLKQNYLQELLASGQNEITFDEEIKSRFEQIKSIKNMNEEDRNQIELLHIKQQNLSKYGKKGLIQFETIKNFHDYYPKQNVEFQISRMKKCGTNIQLSHLLRRYMGYLLYPAEFINSFKLIKSDKHGCQMISEQSEE